MTGLLFILILLLVGAGLFQAHRWGYDKGFHDGYEDGEEEGYRCGKDELERGYKKKYKAAVRRVAAVISKKERERFSKKLEEIKEEFI